MVGKVVQGYDFVNNDNNPQDDYGHGTHVAGIAAARGNNGLGIAGVSWGAQIMPVKVLNSFGQGSFSNVAASIIWATDHSAQIINMSLGGSNYSQILQDAVDYAARRNVLLVASSGNTNSNFILYPARLPQVIAVAATNANNQHASFSNYGAEIDIAAPGDNILSLWLGGGYSTFSGTSMATAYVSGLAAVLLGYDNNARTVRQHLEATALDISAAGWDMYTGAGLIQMDAAIRRALSPTPAADPEIANQQGGPIQFFASLTPIWTQTNLSTITPVPVTQTFTVTPGPSALSLPNLDEATQSVPFTPRPKEGGQKLDFQSPYFYCGSALI
ncbi:MAG TPA: S8 family serine peptidase, partial [Anaerolineales bacterium]|nr:S8 family serine peptidase [Anaerolineales bacterium]